jgi:hypothetical protein
MSQPCPSLASTYIQDGERPEGGPREPELAVTYLLSTLVHVHRVPFDVLQRWGGGGRGKRN